MIDRAPNASHENCTAKVNQLEVDATSNAHMAHAVILFRGELYAIYIKIQPQTKDLSTRLWGINTEFVGFIPQSLVLRSLVLD